MAGASASAGPRGGAAARRNHIVCQGCQTLLMYPDNAQHVRCALCRTVRSRPAPAARLPRPPPP